MMKINVLTAVLLAAISVHSQPNINSWHLNTTGAKGKYWDNPGPILVTMSDSAGITKLCYSSSYVYVRTRDLAGNFTMGPSLNPNDPVAQNYTIRFPRNPVQQTGSQTAVPLGGGIGLAVNGVLLYGSRSADSYKSSTNNNSMTGDGKWHCDAWYNEKNTMDTSGNAHADPSGKYHYHANPKRLYTYPSTSHSPIMGYAIDGFPIYGPYGYSTATNSLSNVARMTSSYQLRSISTRTAYANGTITSPSGPNVSTSFPLGMYVEDYEYVNSSGTLDVMNGRYCVTPDYPAGTYAYFMTVDNTGNPAYPYLLAINYYGVVTAGDAGINFGNSAIPTTGVTCLTSVTKVGEIIKENENFLLYPNPVNEQLTIDLKNGDYKTYTVMDLLGHVVLKGHLNTGLGNITVEALDNGIYFIVLSNLDHDTQAVRFIKN
ncbi:MAG: hypothetical protein K0R26_2239 [Bacteroidota bacterium]|jgi:hypothetical protein|nr:hypothetical protein [Bacteroidota bacterium]